MTAAAKVLFDQSQLVTGHVRLAESRVFTVSLEDGPVREIRAKRAASCLLAPVSGDRVLVALLPEPYLLAVLDRDLSTPAQVRFDGDARIESPGQLDLGGAGGLRLRTAGLLSLLASKLQAEASAGELLFERLTAFGRAAQVSFEELGLVAKTCDLVAERVASRLRRAYRTVEEYDQLRARHIDYRAEQMLQIHGESSAVTAEQVVKIDGAQVHIG